MDAFFKHFAVRKNNENDLSDFTWALCMASDYFKIKFLNFFFPNKKFDNTVIVEREKTGKNNSRVDFFIKISDKEKYIIECKINDRNYHFEQYAKDFEISNDKMGFISNYKIYKKGFITKRWDEFYDELSKDLRKISDNIPCALIKGFLIYLKEVCNLDIIKMEDIVNYKELYSAYNFTDSLNKSSIYKNDLINNEKLYSVYCFTVLLKKTINKITIEDKYSLICQDDPYLKWGIAGYYFNLILLNKNKSINYLFIGIYSNIPSEEKLPKLNFLFEKSKIAYDTYENLKNKIKNFKGNNDYFMKPEEDDEGIWFTLKEEKLRAYNLKNVEENSKLIDAFINSVLEFSFHDF